MAEALRNANVGVAAQDLYWEREGAFTGEVSAAMIKEAGAEYVIIGHSERRRLFGETDATVNRKLVAAIGAGLDADRLRRRDARRARAQRDAGGSRSADQVRPRRAHGRIRSPSSSSPTSRCGRSAPGRTATAAQAQEAHQHIRGRLRQWFGADAAERCHVIYGGSVKPDNIAELMREPDVDGALVGGASLEVRSFAEIVTKSRPATV